MPEVVLPDELIADLEESETETIDDTVGPGVAVYSSSDGRTRAVIYVGLGLDGVARYRNISASDPSIKMQFSLEPVISCHSDAVLFTPDRDDTIAIQVHTCYTGIHMLYFMTYFYAHLYHCVWSVWSVITAHISLQRSMTIIIRPTL